MCKAKVHMSTAYVTDLALDSRYTHTYIFLYKGSSKLGRRDKDEMASWVRTITSPFRKACTFFNHNNSNHHRDKKSQQGRQEQCIMDNLQGEVMACAYEDVQVMWSILDKSKPRTCTLTS